jgi:hypothetical protein
MADSLPIYMKTGKNKQAIRILGTATEHRALRFSMITYFRKYTFLVYIKKEVEYSM